MSHSIKAQITKCVNAPLKLAMFSACLYVWLMNWKFQLIMSEKSGSTVFGVKHSLDWAFRGSVWCWVVFLLRPFLPATLFPIGTVSPRQDCHLWRPPGNFFLGRLVTSDKIFKNSHQVKATVQSRMPGMELDILWQVFDINELLQ